MVLDNSNLYFWRHLSLRQILSKYDLWNVRRPGTLSIQPKFSIGSFGNCPCQNIIFSISSKLAMSLVHQKLTWWRKETTKWKWKFCAKINGTVISTLTSWNGKNLEYFQMSSISSRKFSFDLCGAFAFQTVELKNLAKWNMSLVNNRKLTAPSCNCFGYNSKWKSTMSSEIVMKVTSPKQFLFFKSF